MSNIEWNIYRTTTTTTKTMKWVCRRLMGRTMNELRQPCFCSMLQGTRLHSSWSSLCPLCDSVSFHLHDDGSCQTLNAGKWVLGSWVLLIGTSCLHMLPLQYLFLKWLLLGPGWSQMMCSVFIILSAFLISQNWWMNFLAGKTRAKFQTLIT